MTPAPPLLCGHPLEQATQQSFRIVCRVCGSFWDLESLAAHVEYDDRYPTERGHFDPRVGALKVRTLRHWLDIGHVQLGGKRVCEVGFGGGTCLPFLAEQARRVLGIEANATTVEHACAAGYRADLLLVDQLPPVLDEPVDLWLFQVAFDHIPDPAAFTGWLRDNSAVGAEILVVAPRADSLSQHLMGRVWLHKLPDLSSIGRAPGWLNSWPASDSRPGRSSFRSSTCRRRWRWRTCFTRRA